jgi:transcription antitermination factor NusA-like protein
MVILIRMAGDFKLSFRVPTDAVGTVMGTRGSRVKEVQEQVNLALALALD